MVRVSEAQWLLLKDAGRTPAKGKPRVKKSHDELPENIVEGQLLSFLHYRGWLCTRRHVGKVVPLGWLLGQLERGPITKHVLFGAMIDLGNTHAADWHAERVVTGGWQVLDVEAKAPGRKPTAEQLEWIKKRQMCGWPATWADSLEMFVDWYHPRFGDAR